MLQRLSFLAVLATASAFVVASLPPQTAAAAPAKKAKKDKGKAKSKAKASPVAEEEGTPAAEAPISLAQQQPWSNFKWTVGPGVGKLGTVADLKLPAGYLFAGREDTQKIMELLENPVSGAELGLLMPDTTEGHWLAVFEYTDQGHIKDDDKDKIDADEILASIKEGNAESNEERTKRGWATVDVTGWAQPPHYNDQTKHLEWAINAVSEGKPVLNYNTRLLGRTGVMSVVLLVAPERLAATLPDYQKMVAAFSYIEGSRYGDYRQGDKLAEYGLAALMVGGGAAIAAKTGLLMQLLLVFKKAWKLLIIGIAAAAAAVKRFFGRLFGSNRVELPKQPPQAPAEEPAAPSEPPPEP